MGSYFPLDRDLTYCLQCYKSPPTLNFCVSQLQVSVQQTLHKNQLNLNYNYLSKMARRLRSPSFAAILLLLSSMLFQCEARHLNELKLANSFKGMAHSFDRLSFRGIKHSGPSQGGPGHRSRNAKFLGPSKDSGPSPGVGHKQNQGMHYWEYIQCHPKEMQHFLILLLFFSFN